LVPVEIQQSASYLYGLDLATISRRDRRFGGIFAIGVQTEGCFLWSERPFNRLRTCERNVQIGDVHIQRSLLRRPSCRLILGWTNRRAPSQEQRRDRRAVSD
jgi:hypothetical protein